MTKNFCRNGRIGVQAAALLGAFSASILNAFAVGPGNEFFRPSHWAPNHVVSLLSHDAGWGNVAYWVQWTGPDSMDYLDDPRHAEGVIEIGWKGHGYGSCGDRPQGALGKGGYPVDVKVEVDHTEDDGDAVLWIADLDILRRHQKANPNTKYLAWWDCPGNDSFSRGANGVPVNPHFQVQLAHHGHTRFCPWRAGRDQKLPECTKVDATLNYIAPGGVATPTMPTAGKPTRQVNMDQSWLFDWNFESGDGAWGVSGASKRRIAGSADQGDRYLYIQPDNQGATSSWTFQRTKVGNVDVETSSNLSLGKRTGTFQFEMAARCPTWSPRWALKSPFVTTCLVDVWVKTDADGAWAAAKHRKRFRIPASGRWETLLADNWESQSADDDVVVWINTNGFPMDIDGVWLSSGLN